MTVLLADDEYPAINILKHYIDWEGLQLELAGTARNGQELIDEIARLRPDIVIADIRMPGMSGLEAIERIREAGLHAAFIIISAYATFEYARTAMTLGVEDFIAKPVQRAELNRVLRHVLSKLAKRAAPDAEVLPEDRDSRIVQQAKDYVATHYGEKLTLETVSAKIFISPAYLGTRFKKETGENFTAYVTQVRLDAAAQMLAENALTIQEIAEQCGFCDSSYLAKIFHKWKGISPLEFRRMMGRKANETPDEF